MYRGALVLLLGLLQPSVSRAQPLVIENVTLVDGIGAPPRSGVSLLIEGDRFAAVGRDVDVSAAAVRVDATGKFAIPGLMDMHVHLRGGLRRLHGYLYSGVTSIYDAGKDPDVIYALRGQEVSEGYLLMMSAKRVPQVSTLTIGDGYGRLVEGGSTPLDAIRMATQNGSIFLGRERDLGVVAPGKLSDFVPLDADPTADIDNTKSIHAVYKGGRKIDRSTLELPVNGANP